LIKPAAKLKLNPHTKNYKSIYKNKKEHNTTASTSNKKISQDQE
jgi:hypothetical protein